MHALEPGLVNSTLFIQSDSHVLVNHFTLVHRTQNVLGEKGRRIRELTAVVQKRFGFPEGSVEVRDNSVLHMALN